MKHAPVAARWFSKTPFWIYILPVLVSANGVGILNATSASYLRLDSSIVKTTVEGQIATTVTTQYFTNKKSQTSVTYAFPMTEQASATRLSWKISGVWRTAGISGKPQDTTLPGGGTPSANLRSYLGATPLYFPIPQTVSADSALVVELTYVEFLPYSFGAVTYSYPNDYRLIDPAVVLAQKLDFNLASPRTIDSIRVTTGQTPDTLTNSGGNARVRLRKYEAAATENYGIRYVLNSAELGLFAYSTALPDSQTPDTLGSFMTFIAEPQPGEATATIAKVFTLIVDCSGSMSGTKMTQAKNAATFIVQNLNPGDKFNLVKFETSVAEFRPTHVSFTTQARDSALAYIEGMVASGTTNISGAFALAIPQFQAATSGTANIVIFMTDGEPTAGITNIPSLTTHIDSLINATETDVNLFSFGIGTDANQQLLTLISAHNSGISAFLGNDEVYSRITTFYNAIRNPVLLNSHIAFSPPRVSEIFPDSLPNLYKGSQMIVAGRYQQGGATQITLSGTAFGQPVAYTYNIVLADTSVSGNEFLPKVWAKRKIETLLIRYYALSASSGVAIELKAQIVALSQAYGIISPFTSFTAPVTRIREVASAPSKRSNALTLASVRYAGGSVILRFQSASDFHGKMGVRIYDLRGQVVRTLALQSVGRGEYELVWDGRGETGMPLPAGHYLYAIQFGDVVQAGKFYLKVP